MMRGKGGASRPGAGRSNEKVPNRGQCAQDVEEGKLLPKHVLSAGVFRLGKESLI